MVVGVLLWDEIVRRRRGYVHFLLASSCSREILQNFKSQVLSCIH
jgi:hypothetical protein